MLLLKDFFNGVLREGKCILSVNEAYCEAEVAFLINLSFDPHQKKAAAGQRCALARLALAKSGDAVPSARFAVAGALAALLRADARAAHGQVRPAKIRTLMGEP